MSEAFCKTIKAYKNHWKLQPKLWCKIWNIVLIIAFCGWMHFFLLFEMTYKCCLVCVPQVLITHQHSHMWNLLSDHFSTWFRLIDRVELIMLTALQSCPLTALTVPRILPPPTLPVLPECTFLQLDFFHRPVTQHSPKHRTSLRHKSLIRQEIDVREHRDNQSSGSWKSSPCFYICLTCSDNKAFKLRSQPHRMCQTLNCPPPSWKVSEVFVFFLYFQAQVSQIQNILLARTPLVAMIAARLHCSVKRLCYILDLT